MDTKTQARPSSGIIDSHAHLTWERFEDDRNQVWESHEHARDQVIANAFSQNVTAIVQAGVELNESVDEMAELSERHHQLYFAVGLHPHQAKLWDNRCPEFIASRARHPKMVAIGECGLDYHYNHSDPTSQVRALQAQVKLARELAKPLIIHTREAWEETFAILEAEGAREVGGVFHCFTGSADLIPKIKALDFYVSFSGIVTFPKSNDIQDAASRIADKRILVETDSPYLAPAPVRGRRNEPANVWLVAEKLAELRGTTLEEIARITSENARRLFRLEPR